MHSRALFLTAIVVLLISGIVFAQSSLTAAATPKGFERHFARLDTDRDGAISRDEAATSKWLSRQYDKVDANGDGKVTSDELYVYMRRHLPAGPMS